MARLEQVRFQPEATLISSLFERYQLEGIIAHFEAEQAGEFYEAVMSAQLRLTPVLAPRLCALLASVRQALGFDEPVELYVEADPGINAYALHAIGGDTPHVVSLTSGMIERMTDEEIRFCIGHEVGHLAYRHYRARLAPPAIGADDDGKPRMPKLLQVRLESWSRLAELSADRAGFEAVDGDLSVIISTFFKLQSGLGPEHLHFDIDAFLTQLAALENMKRRDVVAAFSHPVTPVRVRALQLFGEAGDDLEGCDLEVARLARLLDFEVSDPIDVHGRDFLVSGGLLAAHSDGDPIDDAQRELLINVVLPMTGDPEAQFARVESAEQAEQMMIESAGWLAENAGEERFHLFNLLAHVVAVDGRLRPGEQDFMGRVAGLLGIPEKRGNEICYEVLSGYLQMNAPKDSFGF